jgi:hypothetical protein
MLLHEAIVEVLSIAGRPMGAGEIAREVNQRELYARKDGNPVPPNQISARANNYRHLFVKRGHAIDLVNRQVTARQTVRRAEPTAELLITDPVWPISERAFQELGAIGDLIAKGLPALDCLGQCGLYAVIAPVGYEATFIGADDVSRAGNVVAPWSEEMLAAKWVSASRLVYIGLAGRHKPRSLKTRLGELLRHCSGRTTDRGPHCGGEILWQLRGYSSFGVVALPTADPPVPRQMEEALLKAFRGRYGALPFANRQG